MSRRIGQWIGGRPPGEPRTGIRVARPVMYWTHPSGTPELRVVYDCPPGTPAGPDPDRAEMLLAEGLANYESVPLRFPDVTMDARIAHRVCEALSGEQHNGDGSSVWSASYNGAGSVTGAWPNDSGDYGHERNPDAYLAGAALAVALTEED